MFKTGAAGRTAEKTLLGSSIFSLAALAIGLAVSNPASAAPGGSGAEKLRRLDIMLMVTGLRCRNTPDNFNSEYGRFTANHMTELNQASAELRRDIQVRMGAARANRELDRISTEMANKYGQGHPWLNCGELRSVTRDLAEVRGRATLEEAADQLLDGNAVAVRR
ncbi:MAG: S-adenosyl-L-homocysteine hydrolase [Novosphingobium sp.]